MISPVNLENTTTNERKKFWLRRWLPLVVLFIIWAIIVGIQRYYLYRLYNEPVVFWRMVSGQIVYWTLWATIYPFIFYMVQRYSLGEGWRNWFIHIPTSIVVSVIHTIAFGLIYCYVIDPEKLGMITKENISLTKFIFKYFILGAIHWYVILYWMMVAATLSFNYFHRYREESVKASQLQYQLAQAQLQALKMQLNPHFLFNTLHAISSLLHKDIAIADRMIARLGDFLRLTLENAGRQEVTLEQELEFLKCYLEIELIRFQDRLSVKTNVDPQTLDALVPNLILQPIVENAIKHGIAPRSTHGHIEILAERNNGNLRLQVKDDGPGLQPFNRESKSSLNFGGVGLVNTQERLLNHYGDSFNFDLTNADEGGLIVTLEFPFRKK